MPPRPAYVLAAASVAVALWAAGVPASASGPDGVAGVPQVPAYDGPCPVLIPLPSMGGRETYHCGDSRLGPAELPEDGVVETLLEGDDRFGGLTPMAFLVRYWEQSVTLDTGGP